MKLFFSNDISDSIDICDDFQQMVSVSLFDGMKFTEYNNPHIELLYLRLMQCLFSKNYVLFNKEDKHNEYVRKLKLVLFDKQQEMEKLCEFKYIESYEEWYKKREKCENIILDFLNSVDTKELSMYASPHLENLFKKEINEDVKILMKSLAGVKVKDKEFDVTDIYDILRGKRRIKSEVNEKEILNVILLLSKAKLKEGFINKNMEEYLFEKSILSYDFNFDDEKMFFFQYKGIVFEKEYSQVNFKKINEMILEKIKLEHVYFLKTHYVNDNLFKNLEQKFKKINYLGIYKSAEEVSRLLYLKYSLVENTKTEKKKKKI